jgi:tRNA(Ile2) C34 agmatinyltransferase TiaS
MYSYEIPEDRRCQVCNARMLDPGSWRCESCGAA